MTLYDLVVLGGGTAGIIAATYAAGLGATVLLAEEARPGGDCLWTGCVPSKALIAAARRAHDMRHADRVGLGPAEPHVDLARIMGSVHAAIAAVEPHDSPERLRAAGVEVVLQRAVFTAPGRVRVGSQEVRYRTALIATGSQPALPPVPGLAGTAVLTSENVWELRDLPARLVVLGGGAVGCELGQAFARLGSDVTLVEPQPRLLPLADREAAELIQGALERDGVTVLTGTAATGVGEGRVRVRLPDGHEREVRCDRILAATGRRARTEGLGLDLVAVATTGGGDVRVDRHLRTTGRNIFAAGDVTGLLPFTHVAGAHAAAVVANALFRLRRSVDLGLVPWAVFTDPEVAQVGLTEQAARERWGKRAATSRADYADLDRAVTDGATTGFAKLVTGPRGRIAGATVVGQSAGESIAETTAWLRNGSRLRDVAEAIHAYPTMTEGPWRAALAALTDRYLTPATRRWTAPLLAALRRLDRPR